MADISKITLPSGTTYDIKDAVARQMASGVIHIVPGTNTTALTDGATTNPITVDGKSYTAVSGDAVFYNNKEFVFDGTKWHEFGDLTGLKALAYKDDASGTYTPAGTVSTPSFTGTEGNLSVTGTSAGTIAITTGVGAANYTPAGTISQPTFSGSELTSTGKFTPSGNVSATADANGNYQPSGSVSTPTISVSSAGSTTTVNSITDVGTLPALTTTVANENLTITFSQGTLPTKGEDTTVKTGDASYSSSQPTFTGSKVQLGFSGTEGNVSVAGTPAGTVSTPTFSGTGADLEATFTGSEVTSTGKLTPSGTVSQPTFSGTQATITVS